VDLDGSRLDRDHKLMTKVSLDVVKTVSWLINILQHSWQAAAAT
jgi:hypothetical protein